MKKILPVLFVTLALSACGERESVTKLRQICEEDVKKEQVKFDCGCQVDIFKKSLKDDQIDLLAKFIETERTSKEEAMNISKQPAFEDMFKILVSKAPEIEKNCLQAVSMTTVNAAEVEKFSAIADQWWDLKGKFKPLHQLNPTRLGYIREKSIKHFGLPDNLTPFKGKRVLDIGCGGGLLTEPMARLGADITGIDASEKTINVAKARQSKTGLEIDYRAGRVEELTEKFDIILNMEVVEHVADPALFLQSCAALLNPGGLMFLASLNRTPKSYLFAILGAEYVLRLLPIGTHEWKKFLKPSEINRMLENQLKLEDITGVHYNPLKGEFSLVADVSVNYMMLYAKA